MKKTQRKPGAVLKLGPLHREATVKETLTLTETLHRQLTLYAELYAETYGDALPLRELLPAMLETFLQSDRTFQRALKMRQRKRQERGPAVNDNDERAEEQP